MLHELNLKFIEYEGKKIILSLRLFNFLPKNNYEMSKSAGEFVLQNISTKILASKIWVNNKSVREEKERERIYM